MIGRLVLCPTPLGNLEDITLRTLRALRECDVIFAEDTRVSEKLLHHYEVAKPVRSFHQRVVAARLKELAKLLEAGKTVAAVTDAGMPGISDPGVELIHAARSIGAHVDVLPGPSALVGAVVLAGFDGGRFRFDGFPARKRGPRRAYLASLASEPAAIVWYEAPTRVLALLEDIEAVLGDRRVFALREYTKKFEQHVMGTAREVRDRLESPPRGEFVVVLEGSAAEPVARESVTDGALRALALLSRAGVSTRTSVEAVCLAAGLPKNAVYFAAQQRKEA